MLAPPDPPTVFPPPEAAETHKSSRTVNVPASCTVTHQMLLFAKQEACRDVRVRLLVLIRQLLMIHRDTGSYEVERQHDLKLADGKLKITQSRLSRRLRLISVLFKDLLFSAALK